MAEVERVTYVIEMRDNSLKSTKNIQRNIGRTQKSFGNLQKTAVRAFAALGAATVFRNMVRKTMEFEEAVSNLSAITGAAGDDLAYLADQAKMMGAASTKTSVQTVEAMKLIASAKPELLSNAAALASVTKEAIVLSEASGLTLPAAAEALTSALNQFGLSAGESSRVINVLAAGSKFAAAEIPDLATSLEEFGGVAESLNISLEESAAAVETLSSKGLKGARAGIQLRNVFLKLGSSTDRNLNPKVVGLSKALKNLAPIQDDVTALTKMFGRQNVIAAQTLIKQVDTVDDLTEALTGTDIAYQQASINTDNLASDVKGLNAAWEGFVLNLMKGDGILANVARSGTQALTKLLSEYADLALGQVGVNAREFAAIAKKNSESIQQDITAAGDVSREAYLIQIQKELDEWVSIQANVKKRLDEGDNFERGEKLLERRLDPITGKGVDIKADVRTFKIAELIIKEMESLLTDSSALEQFMGLVKPKEEIEFANLDYTKEAKKLATTITAAPPRTFNINIDKLIETQEINTTNLKESATEVKKQITMAMAEALADVEPITE